MKKSNVDLLMRKKKKWEIVQFPFSLIFLIPTESGNSCFDEGHQPTLSGLNYSIVLFDLGMLCVKTLRIFKNLLERIGGTLEETF